MFAHDIRGGYWWNSSRAWTFPEILHYILLPCNTWKQRDTLTEWKWNKAKMYHWIPLHRKKMALIDIHQHLLNIYGDQTMDMRTVRQWVVHFSSTDSDIKDKPGSRQSHTAVKPWNKEHLDELICTNWLVVMIMLKNTVL